VVATILSIETKNLRAQVQGAGQEVAVEAKDPKREEALETHANLKIL